MEKLIARVEALVADMREPRTEGTSQTEILAAKLRSALASNAMGGRVNDECEVARGGRCREGRARPPGSGCRRVAGEEGASSGAAIPGDLSPRAGRGAAPFVLIERQATAEPAAGSRGVAIHTRPLASRRRSRRQEKSESDSGWSPYGAGCPEGGCGLAHGTGQWP